MRTRRLASWAARLAAIAAFGVGVALAGSAVANADAFWHSDDTGGDTTVDDSAETPPEEGAGPDEAKWDGADTSTGWSLLREAKWD